MTQIDEHLSPDILNSYVDRELTPIDDRVIQQHLASCQPCTLRVLSATRLKAATARAGLRYVPEPEALTRLTAQVRPPAPATTRIFAIRRWAWLAAAAALLVVLGLIGWNQTRQNTTLAAEILDQHLAVRSSGTTPQVISSDRHTVKPWFQGRLPFSFNLPDSLPPDTTLKGADLTYLGAQPAALLLFNVHKHDASVFLMQRSGALDGSLFRTLSGRRAGFDFRSATTRDLRIIAVSDVNKADLDRLVSALVQAQSPQ